MPSAASSSDTAPSTLSSAAATFCAYSEPATSSSNATTSATPAFGSIAAASRRTAAKNPRGGPLRPNKESSPILAVVPLPVWQINVGCGRLRQPCIFAVLHQAGHRRPRAVHLDPAPQGAGAFEIASRERLIDNRHRRAVFVVPFREIAPFQYRNPQNLEKARRNRVGGHAHLFARTGNVPFHLYAGSLVGPDGQRHRVCEAHRGNAGERPDAGRAGGSRTARAAPGSDRSVSRWYCAYTTLPASKPG